MLTSFHDVLVSATLKVSPLCIFSSEVQAAQMIVWMWNVFDVLFACPFSSVATSDVTWPEKYLVRDGNSILPSHFLVNCFFFCGSTRPIPVHSETPRLASLYLLFSGFANMLYRLSGACRYHCGMHYFCTKLFSISSIFNLYAREFRGSRNIPLLGPVLPSKCKSLVFCLYFSPVHLHK